MKAEQVAMIAEIGSTLAVETLLEYLRLPPGDAAAATSQDRAAMALMRQQQRIADALRARLGVPDQEPGDRRQEKRAA